MIIKHNKIDYNIPIMVRVSEGSITVDEKNGELDIDVSSPSTWSYAKLSITNKQTGETLTESITPTKKSEISVYQPGEYWIEAKIKDDGKTLSVYETIQIEKIEQSKNNLASILNIPEKPILIISAVMIIMVVVGLLIRR
jgi:flagellar hook assembly protein FlgD